MNTDYVIVKFFTNSYIHMSSSVYIRGTILFSVYTKFLLYVWLKENRNLNLQQLIFFNVASKSTYDNANISNVEYYPVKSNFLPQMLCFQEQPFIIRVHPEGVSPSIYRLLDFFIRAHDLSFSNTCASGTLAMKVYNACVR